MSRLRWLAALVLVAALLGAGWLLGRPAAPSAEPRVPAIELLSPPDPLPVPAPPPPTAGREGARLVPPALVPVERRDAPESRDDGAADGPDDDGADDDGADADGDDPDARGSDDAEDDATEDDGDDDGDDDDDERGSDD